MCFVNQSDQKTIIILHKYTIRALQDNNLCSAHETDSKKQERVLMTQYIAAIIAYK